MSEETRVGHRTTSVLESECKKYILAHMTLTPRPSGGYRVSFEGNPHYLRAYTSLCKYNGSTPDVLEEAIQRLDE